MLRTCTACCRMAASAGMERLLHSNVTASATLFLFGCTASAGAKCLRCLLSSLQCCPDICALDATKEHSKRQLPITRLLVLVRTQPDHAAASLCAMLSIHRDPYLPPKLHAHAIVSTSSLSTLCKVVLKTGDTMLTCCSIIAA